MWLPSSMHNYLRRAASHEMYRRARRLCQLSYCCGLAPQWRAAAGPQCKFQLWNPWAMDGKGFILVVETDDLMRALLERWLEEAGYAVIAAGQGAMHVLPRADSPRLMIVN